MSDTKQQLKLSRRCLNLTEKSDLIDVLREDIMRDQSAVNNIIQNRDLVTTLATRSPDELIEIYNSHIIRSQSLLQTIGTIPVC